MADGAIVPRLSPRAILERLVAFDTVSAGSNLALIDWVRDYLAAHGVASELTWSPSRDKANLFATIGPAGRGGIVLSGHTDVVPVVGQAWDSDPFRLVERGGKLYGRGTADMKSFIALALAFVPEWRAMNLAIPIHLALSFDEETGCHGVPRLLEALPAGTGRPRLAIVGEPTLMKVVNGHKGCCAFRTVVRGREGHSSAPHRAANAIFAASQIIGFLLRLAEEKRAEGRPEAGFEPPYTTFNVGMIEGGTALNIVPRDCRFLWEFRPVPGEDPAALRARVDDFVAEEVLPRLRAAWPEASVETETLALVPVLEPVAASPAEALARALTGANGTELAAFASEAGLFQEAGIPAVLCGPGSIEQAHQPNEFITLEQIEAGARFLRRLGGWACSPEAMRLF